MRLSVWDFFDERDRSELPDSFFCSRGPILGPGRVSEKENAIEDIENSQRLEGEWPTIEIREGRGGRDVKDSSIDLKRAGGEVSLDNDPLSHHGFGAVGPGADA